jgi:hypothetical protein
VTRLDQREKRLGQLKKGGSVVSKSIAQFLRFEHLIHIGLWSNGFGAAHYCKLARKPISPTRDFSL